MKKLFLCVCLVTALIFSNTLPAAACWMAPEPFEIFSADGSRVFVFTPGEDGSDSAYAAVYETAGGERQIIYTVEDLSSFAYESNFRFSSDMMHFVRTFNPSGMPVFEVFSSGIRTRVVARDDFIEDYASIEAETSIGPMYTVRWKIEEQSPHSGVIIISTDEDNTFAFDLADARFEWEDALADETPIESSPVPNSQAQPLPAAISGEVLPLETLSVVNPVSVSQERPSPNAIIIIAGSAVVVIGAGVFFMTKRKKAQ